MVNVTYQPTEEKILDLSPNNIEVVTYDEVIKINEISDTTIVNPSIQGGTIVSGSGDQVFRADPTYGIWLGNAVFDSAPFSVTMEGVLTTSSIIVVGGTIRYGKTTFADTTNAGYYISSSGVHFGQSATSYLKYTIGGNLEWTGGAIDGTSTIDGRIASVLKDAIDASGHFADDAINTASGTILGEFNFTGSGALQIGTYVNGTSGDIKISPTGILGRDKTGATTFSINGTTGVAVLNGLVVGTNVGIGTAEDSAGVTTIVGNTVTTAYVNALNITAEYVAASISITSPTITGGTIQTSATGNRIVVTSDTLESYDNESPSVRRFLLDENVAYFFNPSGNSYGSLYSGSNNFNIEVTSGHGITFHNDSSIIPFAGNEGDLGSSSLQFKNLYIDGTAYIDALSMGGSITPESNDSYDLGSASYNWQQIYVSDSSSYGIYFGATKMLYINSSDLTVGADLDPGTRNTYTLGSSGEAWKDLHLQGGLFMYSSSTTTQRVLHVASTNTANLYCDKHFIPIGTLTLGDGSNKWNYIYRNNESACDLPTSNSGIGIVKKIARPKIQNGIYGKRHYFTDKDFPEEMKCTHEGRTEIEFTRLMGVNIQATRELIDKFDELDTRLKKVEGV